MRINKILFIEILAIVLSMCSPNPVPVITLLSPDSKVCHMPEFTLTVTGSGFVEESQIVFNGTAKTTTFVSASELNCQIYTDDIPTGPASILVSVTSPSTGGGDSNELTFNVRANHSFTTPLQLTNFIIVDPLICREAVADVGIDVSLDDSIHLVIGQGHYLSDYGPGTGDIYFTHSRDGGNNWNSLQILPVLYGYLPDIASIYECIFGIFYKIPWAAGHASDLRFIKTENCDSWSIPLDMTPDAFTERFQYKLITDQSKNFHLVYRDSNYDYIPNNWQIAYRQSNDGGTTWSGRFNVSNNLTPTHVIFPNITVEESGAILVVWSGEEADVYNIKFSRSIDSGLNWSVPVRLSHLGGDSTLLSPF
ncbi:MAG: exo-alpha-sialidase, partial [Candidatus Aminicenantes bacterium]|nr:exo-alpha-sialidase [Candidatus Aminicenantes bacterium]